MKNHIGLDAAFEFLLPSVSAERFWDDLRLICQQAWGDLYKGNVMRGPLEVDRIEPVLLGIKELDPPREQMVFRQVRVEDAGETRDALLPIYPRKMYSVVIPFIVGQMSFVFYTKADRSALTVLADNSAPLLDNYQKRVLGIIARRFCDGVLRDVDGQPLAVEGIDNYKPPLPRPLSRKEYFDARYEGMYISFCQKLKEGKSRNAAEAELADEWGYSSVDSVKPIITRMKRYAEGKGGHE